MAISPIQRQDDAPRTERPERPAVAPPLVERKSAEARRGREIESASIDKVQFSVQAQQLQVFKGLPVDALVAVEGSRKIDPSARADREADPVQSVLDKAYNDLLDRAGKSEYLESISHPTDLSSKATAGRILGGITGYIFAAYRMQHPNMSAEDLARFKDDALRGFTTGLSQAKELIAGLGSMNDTLAADIDETERLFRKGFDDFYEDQLKLLQGDNEAQSGQAGAAAPSPAGPRGA